MNRLADFALAWRLLTVIPLPFIPEESERPAGPAAGYYPLVGLILGLLLAGVKALLDAALPAHVAAALLLSVWAALTGLLHLDGFMDSCDGLLPPRSPERRLDIMRDSRVGAFGVIGVVLLLLAKFSALTALPAPAVTPALIAIPSLARWAMTWQMARYPLARQEGLSVFFGQGLGWPQVILASLVGGGSTLLALGWLGSVLLVVAWLLAMLLARLALARIGGLTGDVYGATCEVIEVALLLGVVGLF